MSTRHMAAPGHVVGAVPTSKQGSGMLPPVSGAGDRVKNLPLFPVGLGYIDVEADRNRNLVAPS
jgi:hypothetical protein